MKSILKTQFSTRSILKAVGIIALLFVIKPPSLSAQLTSSLTDWSGDYRGSGQIFEGYQGPWQRCELAKVEVIQTATQLEIKNLGFHCSGAMQSFSDAQFLIKENEIFWKSETGQEISVGSIADSKLQIHWVQDRKVWIFHLDRHTSATRMFFSQGERSGSGEYLPYYSYRASFQ